MSDKFTEFIGFLIKIKCAEKSCIGEIVAVDENTIVLTNSSINGIFTNIKFLGINITLIHGIDIINHMTSIEASQIRSSFDVTKAINVYTSATKPPVIKKGGSSSAVHRNLKQNNCSQEKIHKSKSSNSTDNGFRPRFTSTGNVPIENHCDINYRTRKTSAGNNNKTPSWLNYNFDDDISDFDFDSNLAMFDKNAFCSSSNRQRNVPDNIGSDSSDSGGINITFKPHYEPYKQRNHSIGIDSLDFLSHDEDKLLSSSDFKNHTHDPKPSTESADVFTELKRMGIIPMSESDILNMKVMSEEPQTELSVDKFLIDHSFLQQPDIVQEVTKSYLSNSSEHSTVLSIKTPCPDFQYFSEFWKLDNDRHFPVFSISQRNKLFECANKFGYDIRDIADQVGKTISEFVIQQVGGFDRLNRLNISEIPKIAVILGRCQTSVLAASIARYLLICGCNVIVYFDTSCHQYNADVETEMKLLNSAFSKYGKNSEYNFLSSCFRDITNITFDYLITGLESESNHHGPKLDLVTWSFTQKAPILAINPRRVSYLPCTVGVFIGVPTNNYHDLQIRTQNRGDNGRFKKVTIPDNVQLMLCNVNLPMAVYSLLNLSYHSPFGNKNLIRLYWENDLVNVE